MEDTQGLPESLMDEQRRYSTSASKSGLVGIPNLRASSSFTASIPGSENRHPPVPIYHWIRGATALRPVHALTIQRLARERRFRLSMEEIYRHSRAIRETESGASKSTP